jgi:hypothetical protein
MGRLRLPIYPNLLFYWEILFMVKKQSSNKFSRIQMG